MDSKNQHGWLNPETEEFLQVSILNTHAQMVGFKPTKFGLDEANQTENPYDAVQNALDNGWVRVNVAGYIRRGGNYITHERFLTACDEKTARKAVSVLLACGSLRPLGSLMVGITEKEPKILYNAEMTEFAEGIINLQSQGRVFR